MSEKIGHKRSRWMRFTALAITLVFTMTSVTWTTPANAAVAEAVAPSFSPIENLVIPADIGTITKTSSPTKDYRLQTTDQRLKNGNANQQDESKKSLQSGAGDSRFVVLIQDAHAVIDAQSNIAKILGVLGKNYGIRLAALEGAKGRLEPMLLRTFPDPIVKRKVLAGYENRAELSGPEMAAVLQEESTDFRGMEDWGLYEKNYFAYLRAQEQKPALLSQWNLVREKLDLQRSEVYDAALNEFHEAHENFLTERASLLDLLVYLSHFKNLLPSTVSTPEVDSRSRLRESTGLGGYQELPGLISSIGYENSGKQEALTPLVRKIADEFKTKYLRELGVKTEMNFYNRYQSFMTGQITAGQMLQYLVQVGRENGKTIKLTPALKKLLGHAELLSEIKGTRLYDELQRFLPQVEASLIKTPVQRELAENYRKLFLLKEMIELELTHEALEQFQQSPEAYLSLMGDPSFRQDLEPALVFYQAALERDQAFYKNIEKLMQKQTADQKLNAYRLPPIAVVAGGFHTNGLEHILKEKGVAYAVVTPKIASLAGIENYAKVMKGDVSFKDYLKTTYFDALMRHAAKGLVEAMPIPDRVRTLKTWRDNVIRELAKDGRITDAGKFLPYIDELLRSNGEAVSVGPKRTKEEILAIVQKELEKFKKDSLERIWKTFEFQLDIFTDGLKGLIAKKDLNTQSVSALLDRASQSKPSFLNAALTLNRENGWKGPVSVREFAFNTSEVGLVRSSEVESVAGVAPASSGVGVGATSPIAAPPIGSRATLLERQESRLSRAESRAAESRVDRQTKLDGIMSITRQLKTCPAFSERAAVLLAERVALSRGLFADDVRSNLEQQHGLTDKKSINDRTNEIVSLMVINGANGLLGHVAKFASKKESAIEGLRKNKFIKDVYSSKSTEEIYEELNSLYQTAGRDIYQANKSAAEESSKTPTGMISAEDARAMYAADPYNDYLKRGRPLSREELIVTITNAWEFLKGRVEYYDQRSLEATMKMLIDMIEHPEKAVSDYKKAEDGDVGEVEGLSFEKIRKMADFLVATIRSTHKLDNVTPVFLARDGALFYFIVDALNKINGTSASNGIVYYLSRASLGHDFSNAMLEIIKSVTDNHNKPLDYDDFTRKFESIYRNKEVFKELFQEEYGEECDQRYEDFKKAVLEIRSQLIALGIAGKGIIKLVDTGFRGTLPLFIKGVLRSFPEDFPNTNIGLVFLQAWKVLGDKMFEYGSFKDKQDVLKTVEISMHHEFVYNSNSKTITNASASDLLKMYFERLLLVNAALSSVASAKSEGRRQEVRSDLRTPSPEPGRRAELREDGEEEFLELQAGPAKVPKAPSAEILASIDAVNQSQGGKIGLWIEKWAQFVKAVRLPAQARGIVSKVCEMLSKTVRRFSLKAVRNLLVLSVAKVLSPVFDLVDRFISVPGIEKVIERLSLTKEKAGQQATSFLSMVRQLTHAAALRGRGYEILEFEASDESRSRDLVVRLGEMGKPVFVEVQSGEKNPNDVAMKIWLIKQAKEHLPEWFETAGQVRGPPGQVDGARYIFTCVLPEHLDSPRFREDLKEGLKDHIRSRALTSHVPLPVIQIEFVERSWEAGLNIPAETDIARATGEIESAGEGAEHSHREAKDEFGRAIAEFSKSFSQTFSKNNLERQDGVLSDPATIEAMFDVLGIYKPEDIPHLIRLLHQLFLMRDPERLEYGAYLNLLLQLGMPGISTERRERVKAWLAWLVAKLPESEFQELAKQYPALLYLRAETPRSEVLVDAKKPNGLAAFLSQNSPTARAGLLSGLEAEFIEAQHRVSDAAVKSVARAEMRFEIEPTAAAIEKWLNENGKENQAKFFGLLGESIGKQILEAGKKNGLAVNEWRMCGPASIALSRILSLKTGLPVGQGLSGDYIELKVGIYDAPVAEQVEEQTYMLIHLGDKVIYVDPILNRLGGTGNDIEFRVFDKDKVEESLARDYGLKPFDPHHPGIARFGVFQGLRPEEIAEFHRISEETINSYEGLLPSSGRDIKVRESSGAIVEKTIARQYTAEVEKVITHFLTPEQSVEYDMQKLAAIEASLSRLGMMSSGRSPRGGLSAVSGVEGTAVFLSQEQFYKAMILRISKELQSDDETVIKTVMDTMGTLLKERLAGEGYDLNQPEGPKGRREAGAFLEQVAGKMTEPPAAQNALGRARFAWPDITLITAKPEGRRQETPRAESRSVLSPQTLKQLNVERFFGYGYHIIIQSPEEGVYTIGIANPNETIEISDASAPEGKRSAESFRDNHRTGFIRVQRVPGDEGLWELTHVFPDMPRGSGLGAPAIMVSLLLLAERFRSGFRFLIRTPESGLNDAMLPYGREFGIRSNIIYPDTKSGEALYEIRGKVPLLDAATLQSWNELNKTNSDIPKQDPDQAVLTKTPSGFSLGDVLGPAIESPGTKAPAAARSDPRAEIRGTSGSSQAPELVDIGLFKPASLEPLETAYREQAEEPVFRTIHRTYTLILERLLRDWGVRNKSVEQALEKQNLRIVRGSGVPFTAWDNTVYLYSEGPPQLFFPTLAHEGMHVLQRMMTGGISMDAGIMEAYAFMAERWIERTQGKAPNAKDLTRDAEIGEKMVDFIRSSQGRWTFSDLPNPFLDENRWERFIEEFFRFSGEDKAGLRKAAQDADYGMAHFTGMYVLARLLDFHKGDWKAAFRFMGEILENPQGIRFEAPDIFLESVSGRDQKILESALTRSWRNIFSDGIRNLMATLFRFLPSRRVLSAYAKSDFNSAVGRIRTIAVNDPWRHLRDRMTEISTERANEIADSIPPAGVPKDSSEALIESMKNAASNANSMTASNFAIGGWIAEALSKRRSFGDIIKLKLIAWAYPGSLKRLTRMAGVTRSDLRDETRSILSGLSGQARSDVRAESRVGTAAQLTAWAWIKPVLKLGGEYSLYLALCGFAILGWNMGVFAAIVIAEFAEVFFEKTVVEKAHEGDKKAMAWAAARYAAIFSAFAWLVSPYIGLVNFLYFFLIDHLKLRFKYDPIQDIHKLIRQLRERPELPAEPTGLVPGTELATPAKPAGRQEARAETRRSESRIDSAVDFLLSQLSSMEDVYYLPQVVESPKIINPFKNKNDLKQYAKKLIERNWYFRGRSVTEVEGFLREKFGGFSDAFPSLLRQRVIRELGAKGFKLKPSDILTVGVYGSYLYGKEQPSDVDIFVVVSVPGIQEMLLESPADPNWFASGSRRSVKKADISIVSSSYFEKPQFRNEEEKTFFIDLQTGLSGHGVIFEGEDWWEGELNAYNLLKNVQQILIKTLSFAGSSGEGKLANKKKVGRRWDEAVKMFETLFSDQFLGRGDSVEVGLEAIHSLDRNMQKALEARQPDLKIVTDHIKSAYRQTVTDFVESSLEPHLRHYFQRHPEAFATILRDIRKYRSETRRSESRAKNPWGMPSGDMPHMNPFAAIRNAGGALMPIPAPFRYAGPFRQYVAPEPVTGIAAPKRDSRPGMGRRKFLATMGLASLALTVGCEIQNLFPKHRSTETITAASMLERGVLSEASFDRVRNAFPLISESFSGMTYSEFLSHVPSPQEIAFLDELLSYGRQLEPGFDGRIRGLQVVFLSQGVGDTSNGYGIHLGAGQTPRGVVVFDLRGGIPPRITEEERLNFVQWLVHEAAHAKDNEKEPGARQAGIEFITDAGFHTDPGWAHWISEESFMVAAAGLEQEGTGDVWDYYWANGTSREEALAPYYGALALSPGSFFAGLVREGKGYRIFMSNGDSFPYYRQDGDWIMDGGKDRRLVITPVRNDLPVLNLNGQVLLMQRQYRSEARRAELRVRPFLKFLAIGIIAMWSLVASAGTKSRAEIIRIQTELVAGGYLAPINRLTGKSNVDGLWGKRTADALARASAASKTVEGTQTPSGVTQKRISSSRLAMNQSQRARAIQDLFRLGLITALEVDDATLEGAIEIFYKKHLPSSQWPKDGKFYWGPRCQTKTDEILGRGPASAFTIKNAVGSGAQSGPAGVAEMIVRSVMLESTKLSKEQGRNLAALYWSIIEPIEKLYGTGEKRDEAILTAIITSLQETAGRTIVRSKGSYAARGPFQILPVGGADKLLRWWIKTSARGDLERTITAIYGEKKSQKILKEIEAAAGPYDKARKGFGVTDADVSEKSNAYLKSKVLPTLKLSVGEGGAKLDLYDALDREEFGLIYIVMMLLRGEEWKTISIQDNYFGHWYTKKGTAQERNRFDKRLSAAKMILEILDRERLAAQLRELKTASNDQFNEFLNNTTNILIYASARSPEMRQTRSESRATDVMRSFLAAVMIGIPWAGIPAMAQRRSDAKAPIVVAGERTLFSRGDWKILGAFDDGPGAIFIDTEQGRFSELKVLHKGHQIYSVKGNGYLRGVPPPWVLWQGSRVDWGTSFVLPGAYWSADGIYHHNPRITSAAFEALPDGRVKLTGTMSDDAGNIATEAEEPLVIIFYPPDDNGTVEMEVFCPGVAQRDFDLDPIRIPEGQALKGGQFSGMYIGDDYHDATTLHATDEKGNPLSASIAVKNQLVFPGPVTLGGPVVYLANEEPTDPRIWMPRPNTYIRLPFGTDFSLFDAQGWNADSSDPNHDTFGGWIAPKNPKRSYKRGDTVFRAHYFLGIARPGPELLIYQGSKQPAQAETGDGRRSEARLSDNQQIEQWAGVTFKKVWAEYKRDHADEKRGNDPNRWPIRDEGYAKLLSKKPLEKLESELQDFLAYPNVIEPLPYSEEPSVLKRYVRMLGSKEMGLHMSFLHHMGLGEALRTVPAPEGMNKEQRDQYLKKIDRYDDFLREIAIRWSARAETRSIFSDPSGQARETSAGINAGNLTPLLTYSGRHKELLERIFEKLAPAAGINFRRGNHTVVDIGTGALPVTLGEMPGYISEAVKDNLGNIRFVGTDLPHAIPRAFLYMDASRFGPDFERINIAEFRAQFPGTEEFEIEKNEFIIAVDNNGNLTHVIGHLQIPRSDGSHFDYATLIGLPGGSKLRSLGGNIIEAPDFIAEYEKIISLTDEMLIKKLISEGRDQQEGAYRILFNPHEKILAERGISFLPTEDPARDGIGDVTLATAFNVTVYMNPSEKEDFISRIGKSIRQTPRPENNVIKELRGLFVEHNLREDNFYANIDGVMYRILFGKEEELSFSAGERFDFIMDQASRTLQPVVRQEARLSRAESRDAETRALPAGRRPTEVVSVPGGQPARRAEMRAEPRLVDATLLVMTDATSQDVMNLMQSGGISAVVKDMMTRATIWRAGHEKEFERRANVLFKKIGEFDNAEDFKKYIAGDKFEADINDLCGNLAAKEKEEVNELIANIRNFASSLDVAAVIGDGQVIAVDLPAPVREFAQELTSQINKMADLLKGNPQPGLEVMTNHSGPDSAIVLKMLQMLVLERLIVLYPPEQPPGGAFREVGAPLTSLVINQDNPKRSAEALVKKVLAANTGGDLVALWTEDLQIGKVGVFTIVAELGKIADPSLKALACAAIRYIFLKYASLDEAGRKMLDSNPGWIRTDLDRMGFGSVIQIQGNTLVFNMKALADSVIALQSIAQSA